MTLHQTRRSGLGSKCARPGILSAGAAALIWLGVAVGNAGEPGPVDTRHPGNSLFKGTDLHIGTAAWFPSLEAARDEIRMRKGRGLMPEGGLTVWLHGGVYLRGMSFELTEADSGTQTSPIIYRAVPGERVRLIGGKLVDAEELEAAQRRRPSPGAPPG